MNKVSVTMHLGKETQGTFVYQEDLSKPRSEKTFPTVYVQKHVVQPDPSKPPPRTITVTIEAANG